MLVSRSQGSVTPSVEVPVQPTVPSTVNTPISSTVVPEDVVTETPLVEGLPVVAPPGALQTLRMQSSSKTKGAVED